MAITRKQLINELLPGLNKLFGNVPAPRIEYHARRTDADPKKWKVVELTLLGKEVIETKELVSDLKRNQAQAYVKLLRGNQKHGS